MNIELLGPDVEHHLAEIAVVAIACWTVVSLGVAMLIGQVIRARDQRIF